jgi:predicted nucleotidyltransferase
MKVNEFQNKTKLIKYIKNLFVDSEVILIRGSTAKGKIKEFSDFDVEVYSNKLRKPYSEIILINKKPALISTYFYKYKKDEIAKEPENVLLIKGAYNSSTKPNNDKDTYSKKEELKRECQMVLDLMFQYLRNKNTDSLENIQKRIK